MRLSSTGSSGDTASGSIKADVGYIERTSGVDALIKAVMVCVPGNANLEIVKPSIEKFMDRLLEPSLYWIISFAETHFSFKCEYRDIAPLRTSVTLPPVSSGCARPWRI